MGQDVNCIEIEKGYDGNGTGWKLDRMEMLLDRNGTG